MARDRTFALTLKYVEHDGDIVILPDPDDIASLDKEIGAVRRQLDAKKADCSAMLKSASAIKEEPARTEALAAVEAARTALAMGNVQLEGLAEAHQRLTAILAEYEPQAERFELKMRRYAYNERGEIRNECRVLRENDTPEIDQETYVLRMLERCIIGWNVKGNDGKDLPVSVEAIDAEIPPPGIDRIYRKLCSKSEASAESLPFRGARVDGSAGGDSGQS